MTPLILRREKYVAIETEKSRLVFTCRLVIDSEETWGRHEGQYKKLK